MATHDYVIDNSTGANVRADINNVLQAILTNNSSSSAPSTTAAYMWWADTTTGILKIRNSANNGWVELLQLDGTLTLEDGSASSPALSFRDDLNTGVYSSAADTFNVATGGVERMELGATTIFNEDGADVDFRIEGDTEANLFYVDAGNNRVGIGTSSPSSTLTVSGNIETSGDVILTTDDEKIQLGASQDFLLFHTTDKNFIYGVGNHPITFSTNNSEKMRIDSSGRLLLGTTTEGVANADDLTIATSGHTGITIRAGTTSQSAIYMSDATSGDGEFAGYVLYDHNVDALRFGANTSDRMRIDSSGTVHIGKTANDFAVEGFSFRDTGSGGWVMQAVRDGSGGAVIECNRHTNVGRQIEFYRGSSNLVGHIESNNTSTSYNTSSDYRLKENVVAISDGITRLKTLKPSRFNFIADSETTVDGFIAHEVTAVPEAISGTKDEVVTQTMIDAGDYEEGTLNDPIYQGIDQSKLVPLLTAALQEAVSKIEVLETKVAALEAA